MMETTTTNKITVIVHLNGVPTGTTIELTPQRFEDTFGAMPNPELVYTLHLYGYAPELLEMAQREGLLI